MYVRCYQPSKQISLQLLTQRTVQENSNFPPNGEIYNALRLFERFHMPPWRGAYVHERVLSKWSERGNVSVSCSRISVGKPTIRTKYSREFPQCRDSTLKLG